MTSKQVSLTGPWVPQSESNQEKMKLRGPRDCGIGQRNLEKYHVVYLSKWERLGRTHTLQNKGQSKAPNLGHKFRQEGRLGKCEHGCMST